MRKLSTKKIVLSLVVVAVAVAIPLIFLKPKPVEEVLPVVGVDVVRTRNVEIYESFRERSELSSSWRSEPAWKAISRR